MNFNVVQIGAYIGKDDVEDMLYEKLSRTALLVEPVPWFFEKLKINYSKITNPERIVFENSAINCFDGECPFFCMEDNKKYQYSYDAETDWGCEISSLKESMIKEHEKNLFKNCKAEYKKLKIPCLTPRTLIKKHNISSIEYLKIDAEGYDGEIVKMWPFDLIKPKYLKFESSHLDGSFNKSSTLQEFHQILLKNKYKYFNLIDRNLIYILK